MGGRLQYEITFNNYNHITTATGDTTASYTINNINLIYECIMQQELVRLARNQYMGRNSILYDCILLQNKIKINKSNTLINIGINLTARSMKGILMLFEDVEGPAFLGLEIQRVTRIQKEWKFASRSKMYLTIFAVNVYIVNRRGTKLRCLCYQLVTSVILKQQ